MRKGIMVFRITHREATRHDQFCPAMGNFREEEYHAISADQRLRCQHGYTGCVAQKQKCHFEHRPRPVPHIELHNQRCGRDSAGCLINYRSAEHLPGCSFVSGNPLLSPCHPDRAKRAEGSLNGETFLLRDPSTWSLMLLKPNDSCVFTPSVGMTTGRQTICIVFLSLAHNRGMKIARRGGR